MGDDRASSVADAIAEAVDELEEAPTTGEEGSTAPEEGGTEDFSNAPVEYMGVDLSDLSDEVRAGIIANLKEKDRYIGKLERRLAEKAEETPPAPEPVATDEVLPQPSDEDILGVYGITEENPYYEVAKELFLPMAKQNLVLMGQVDSMNQQLQAEAAWTEWDSTLDRMEREYGELPVDRDQVIEFAVEQGIQDPETAYLKLAVGAQKMLHESATEARKRELEELRGQKKSVTSGRPRSMVPTETKAVTPSGNVAADFRSAATAAAKELGVDWEEAAQTFLNRR